MNYRRLGRSGLLVSELALGAGTFGRLAMNEAAVREAMEIAYAAGVNFFDNAENYGATLAEEYMGRALQSLEWPRVSYVISTKFYWGLAEGPNRRNTLNRKYLLQAIEGSLRRLQLDYVDLVYCHRPDPNTPIEETVWAMHDMIARGQALYWGTSEWSAAQIDAACEIADKRNLHAPVVEEPEYNLFFRRNVEQELAGVCRLRGIGLTTWSPLAGGTLTGKYRDGARPENSRATAAHAKTEQSSMLLDSERNAMADGLAQIAQDLGCPLAHLAIAWCAKNPLVSSVILGCSRPEQIASNLPAIEVIPQLTPEVLKRIDAVLGGYDRSWTPSRTPGFRAT